MATVKLNVRFFIQSKPNTWATSGAHIYSLDSSGVFFTKIKELAKEYNSELEKIGKSDLIVPDIATVYEVTAENTSNKGFYLEFKDSTKKKMTVDEVIKFFETEFAKRGFGNVKYYNVHFR